MKGRDFFLQTSYPLAVGRDVDSRCPSVWFCLPGFDFAGEEMGIARFLGAGLPGKNLDERWFALHQVLQAGLHGAEVVKMVQAFGAAAEFARRLGAAQEQNREDGNFVAIEVESFLEAVLVLGHAAVRGADGANEGLAVQGMQRLADGGFVEIHDGFAVRFLVAGVEECVQREWIVFGSGDLFFDERAQDPAFDFGQ